MFNRLENFLEQFLTNATSWSQATDEVYDLTRTSRHSWATAARNHNVPISVISAGMGHTSEQATQIYLTMLENSVIDDANKGIIGGLE